jgi:GT2 family glycosyltransferase
MPNMYQDRARRASLAAPTVREVVVVIPAHNEEERLARCLRSVATAADQVEVPVTVLVVLDACTDRSADAVTGAARTLCVRGRNVGMARAAGFAAAAANPDPRVWLATTDADCVVPPNWLAKQLVHQRGSMLGVVGTVSVHWNEHSPQTRLRYDRLYRATGPTHDHVHGANLAVRADAYWRVGGFRPLQVGEDVDLVDRLLNAGTPLVWDTDNAVLTSDRRDSRAPGGFGDYVRSLAESDDPVVEAGIA